MGSALLKRLQRVEPLIKAASGRLEPTVYGIVDRVDNVDGVSENITDYIRENDLIQGRLVDLTAIGISRVVKIVLAKTQGSYFLIEE